MIMVSRVDIWLACAASCLFGIVVGICFWDNWTRS